MANQAEIAAGQTALRRTQSRSVRFFANRMIDEHGQVNQETAGLMQRLAATPQRSGISDALAAELRRPCEAQCSRSSRVRPGVP
ncbi:DUF4142 domain-containing protein [Paraburkholderia sediminicola]|uniref:DUF4142 domain-containing protein n=1 Tax=Paraburkholderia rhynchosiae TaxID=487049 RepID=A0ACC7NN08_9BURK